MTLEEKTKQAWNLYVCYPNIIYLFCQSGRLNEQDLKLKLRAEPISLSENEAIGMFEQIRTNPLFTHKGDIFEINQEIALCLVDFVKESLGVKNSNDAKKEPVIISEVIPRDQLDNNLSEELDNESLEAADKPLVNGFLVPALESRGRPKFDVCNLKDNFVNNIEMINKGMKLILSKIGHSSSKSKDIRKDILKELTNENNPLFSKMTSYQKLIYYVSFNPDITEEQKNNILLAAKNGMDAKLMLELMETDKDLFSIEYFNFMIELAKQQTEARMMTDLAKRLLLGEWYVSAKVDGVDTKFALRKIP